MQSRLQNQRPRSVGAGGREPPRASTRDAAPERREVCQVGGGWNTGEVASVAVKGEILAQVENSGNALLLFISFLT